METKIIDNNSEGGTVILDNNTPAGGTVILDGNNASGSGTVILDGNNASGSGTVILDDNNASGSGTVILDDNNNPASGTVLLDDPSAVTSNQTNESLVQNNIPAAQAARLKGPILAEGVEVLTYTIKNQMNTNSAEADLYIAEKEGKTFAFKYYRSSHKPKNEVVEKIKNLKNPHIVKLYDYGFYNDRFFEVYE